ncbi:alcohol dehydrogenase catalytic domain-containing protein [Alkalihalobacillus sp. 1P02AB]|uniref:alcohol dehydrogenase catalytic domain-containing protein n=1 Tax=Alkalihalobacillus sp. 1P02AB TaxID=3132260 RepID=UPI0039A4CF80
MTMKSLIKERAGQGLTYRQSEIPKPNRGEVLIRIKLSAICGSDLHIYQWNDWAAGVGIKVPGIAGHECTGEVVELGLGVTSLVVGDRVSVETHIPCGECELCLNDNQHICENLTYFGLHTDGCFAEWAVVPEVCLRKIPDSIPEEIGAILEPLGVGVHAAQVGDVKGKRVVVLGAGPIGLYSACASQALEAESVYISDLRKTRLDVASQCGDFKVFNPVETPISTLFSGNNKVDVIIETTGSARAFNEAFPYLKKGGTAVMVGLFPGEVATDLSSLATKEITLRGISGREMWSTWDLMEQLLLENKLNVAPSITHQFSLEDFEEAFKVALNGEGVKVLLRP